MSDHLTREEIIAELSALFNSDVTKITDEHGNNLSDAELRDLLDSVRVTHGSPQKTVAGNVAKRGYRTGWTAEQFMGRNIAKLQEELGELAESIWGWPALSTWETLGGTLERAKDNAKYCFDQTEPWKKTHFDISQLASAKKEAADIQVVLFNIAAALEELGKGPFDVVQAAVEKSQADVGRGIRKTEED